MVGVGLALATFVVPKVMAEADTTPLSPPSSPPPSLTSSSVTTTTGATTTSTTGRDHDDTEHYDDRAHVAFNFDHDDHNDPDHDYPDHDGDDHDRRDHVDHDAGVHFFRLVHDELAASDR